MEWSDAKGLALYQTFTRKVPAMHIAAAILGLLVVGTLVARTSSAAFSATTDNTANSWSAGSVAISDDDAAAAMFTVANLSPGVGSTECITVTYAGSIDTTVKLYGAVTGGDGLDTYLDVTVRRGSGGSFGDCTGFSAVETVYTGTLAGLVAAHSDFASGAGTWAPTGGAPDDDMTYEFAVTLQDDDLAQGKAATATFTWEAQSS